MRRVVLIIGVVVALAAPASAHALTRTELTLTMDDGVALAATLYTPDGAAPAGGWPGIVALHGLAGTRSSIDAVSTTFANAGYAVLAYDARGHGASGGNIELAAPREVADLRAVRNTLAARPDVSDTQIGAWGISYGGGQIWNALAAGVPFAAAEVLETWTSLYDALWPGNVARSLIVAGFAGAVAARSPLIASLRDDAVASRNLERIRDLARERSAAGRLGSVMTPVYMFQGRVDFAFDVTQATQALAALAGPKKLYVGNFGHSPSTFPGADVQYVLEQAVAWYDRFLKGVPNGVDSRRVVIAHEASATGRTEYATVPPARPRTFVLRGRSTVRGSGSTSRRTARLAAPLETWGGGSLRLTVTRVANYERLVVTVLAGNRLVTHGAVRPRRGTNVVRLANYVVHVPRGTPLTVTIGSASPPGHIAYGGVGTPGSISVGRATLTLGTLTRPVSGT